MEDRWLSERSPLAILYEEMIRWLWEAPAAIAQDDRLHGTQQDNKGRLQLQRMLAGKRIGKLLQQHPSLTGNDR